VDTAAEIRKFHPNTPYEELAILVERSKGEAEGMDRDAFRINYPATQDAWDRELDARPPGGENFEDVHSRVIPVIDRHVREHGPGATLLYVLHGNVNRVILGHMMNVPHRFQPRIVQGYCALNIAEYNHVTGRWAVECINRQF
jgi:broad specificity phosphatase PhoE